MAFFQLRGALLTWATITSCSLAMLLFGYDQGLMSGLISSDNFKQQIFHTQSPSASITGLVVAIYEIGAFIGAVSVMLFGERLGRKKTTVIAEFITIIGAIIQATSYGLSQTMAARVINGFGVGQITATVPVWAAEIAPASSRGKAVGSLTMCAVTGVVTAYWVDYGASYYNSSFSFRFPLALQLFFCILQLLTVPFLPESPRWLMASGHEEQAKEVVLRIYDVDSLEADQEATAMFLDVQQIVEIENDGKSPWRDLFTMGPRQYFRRICLAFGTQAMQQLSGINVLAYYSTVVFKESVHMSNNLALLMGGFVSMAFWCGTVVAFPLVDRVGRRRLMIWGYTCACIGMAITAIGMSKDTKTYGIVATFGLFFFNFNFGVGLQIPPWLYGVEITPLKLRYIAGAVSAASGWIWNFGVVQVTPPGIAGMGYKFFIIWAAFNFTFIWVIYFFYPETARKTLEQLDFIFENPIENGNAVMSMTTSDVEGVGAVAKSAQVTQGQWVHVENLPPKTTQIENTRTD